jgi:hypothetical protein
VRFVKAWAEEVESKDEFRIQKAEFGPPKGKESFGYTPSLCSWGLAEWQDG